MIDKLIKLNATLTGTLTLPPDATNPTERKVVFQGASNTNANYWTPSGEPRKVRAHVIPADPRTPSQLARRSHMRNGVLSWQALSPAEKATWRERDKSRNLTPFQHYISAWLKTPPPQSYEIWDAFISAWDNGASTWDGLTSTWDTITPSIWDNGASIWN